MISLRIALSVQHGEHLVIVSVYGIPYRWKCYLYGNKDQTVPLEKPVGNCCVLPEANGLFQVGVERHGDWNLTLYRLGLHHWNNDGLVVTTYIRPINIIVLKTQDTQTIKALIRFLMFRPPITRGYQAGVNKFLLAIKTIRAKVN